MKRKYILGICTISLTLALGVGFFGTNALKNSPFFANNVRGETMDCGYYFSEANGFTSIYDINQAIKAGDNASGTYKTWGTVTKNFISSNRTNTYIQSTDKNGNTAAILLYNCNTPESSYPEGCVVELVTDKTKCILYNNLPEITAIQSINKVYDENPYDIEPFEINTSNWVNITDSASEEFATFYSYGPRKAVLNGVTISSAGNSSAIAILNPNAQASDQVQATLYYANVGASSSITSAISSKLSSYVSTGTKLKIYGYISAFINKSTTMVEILLRSEDDIYGDIHLDYLEVEDAITSYTLGDSFITPRVNAVYSDGTKVDVTSSCSFSSFSSDVTGKQTIEVTYIEDEDILTTSYDVSIFNENGYFETYIGAEYSYLISHRYSTGNYGDATINGIAFEYYNAYGDLLADLVELIPVKNHYSDALGGSIYNIDPIANMQAITIDYYTESSYGSDKPTLHFGENAYTGSMDLNFSTYSTSFRCDSLSGSSYFKIESGDSNLYVNSIRIEYLEGTPSSFQTRSMGEGYYRVNPSVYEGELIDGVSQVSVPTKVSYNTIDNSYSVIESKTYTYYSYDYVSSHTYLKNSAAMVDPIDVCNYVSIFKEAPANYVTNKQYSSAYSIFGNLTRCISSYSKADGYATAVPVATDPITEKPYYYEFDIDIGDSYSSSNRGVGRVVAFETGYALDDYENGNVFVCLFTDDHYATFQEFNNLGDFLPRFNAERRLTNYSWGAPNTL